MPKDLLRHTDVLNAKPTGRPQKLSDGAGLFLLISPNGGKWWRFRYLYLQKEKLLSLGSFPDVSLKEARDKREALRKLLSAGVDPATNRKAKKAAKVESAANSFEVISREWLNKKSSIWALSHSDKIIRRLERDVLSLAPLVFQI